ncbi:VWA domain-containing protein [Luteimonas yindakuii]|uniref:vWA domain-containing protein n=1 Tax=Luteimonas yindakuii TaxID=2565782 RepID=UPI0010A41D21|nr:VWA domain-containing protein [Luteimonas yindakuii]QCO67848.1 VWA domain-containing protein [Luteimonas yindakuii]
MRAPFLLLACCLGLIACHPTRVADTPSPPGEPAGEAASPTPEPVPVYDMAMSARTASEVAQFAPPPAPPAPPGPWNGPTPGANTERYASRTDNPVQRTADTPVSTFSIDVDTGSYSNVRRMLRQGVRPPADAVRAEEFINYFRYGHPAPSVREVPFRITTELAPSPWARGRQLLMIGLRGYDVPRTSLPAANLVFLIDTSGSMGSPDKLPLLQKAFAELVAQLRPQDRVSLVTYAGSAGLVLAPTPGDRKAEILSALRNLHAGGSTHGSAGLHLAYETARQAHVEGGINRVILATDGDFNVGIVDRGALETYVADQRRGGIALSTLGFGQGNYHDAMAERLADVGDGQHAYIDTLQEARKVLVEELSSTLLTIANDVKVQVEFDPARVAEYRLIGYENRVLREEDFANDRVDAGDIGAGHEVTALYETVPVGSADAWLSPRRYGTPSPQAASSTAGEIARVSLRYKLPGETRSRLVETTVRSADLRMQPGESLRFAAAVAAYADALRGGTRLGDWGWDDIRREVAAARGGDPWGLRGELLGLVDLARAHADAPAATTVPGQPSGAGRPNR